MHLHLGRQVWWPRPSDPSALVGPPTWITLYPAQHTLWLRPFDCVANNILLRW